jgi:hypothetical protein
MPDVSDTGVPATFTAGAERLSRRSVLRTAAGAGAAGIAATALAGIAFPAAADASTAGPAARSRHADAASTADSAETVVVHVRDAATGEIDVFRGTTHTRLHDRGLAAQLVRASK